MCNTEFASQCQKMKKNINIKKNAIETNTEHRGKLRKMCQLTFPEFHFETEAKVDFPSACI